MLTAFFAYAAAFSTYSAAILAASILAHAWPSWHLSPTLLLLDLAFDVPQLSYKKLQQ